MTVEEMIAERTVKVTAALDEANDTISMMGGNPSEDLSGLYKAIATIPQEGGLPTGIAEISCGTFTAAADAPNTHLNIPHGLSAKPDFYYIFRKDNTYSGNGAMYILGAVYDSRGSSILGARLISNASGNFSNTGMNLTGTYSDANALNLSVYNHGGYGIKAGDYDWVAIRFEEA